MKKQIIITLFLLCVTSCAYTQNFKYDYDANGNRIIRETIVLNTKMAYSENANDSISNLEIRTISKDNIKIYPNPTKGNLKVELDNNIDIKNIRINVLNMNGQIVFNTEEVLNTYSINLASFPDGAYLLIMQVNDSKYEWKIIKN